LHASPAQPTVAEKSRETRPQTRRQTNFGSGWPRSRQSGLPAHARCPNDGRMGGGFHARIEMGCCCRVVAGDGRVRLGGRACRYRWRYVPAGSHALSAGGHRCAQIDQNCVNQAGEVWPCGVAARDRLTAHIGNRAVSCKDEGPDPDHKLRRIGICSIEGEAITLNEWLVSEGWAIRFGSSATGRFAPEEADARNNRRGLWSGCFAEPLDFRRWNLSAARLVGGGCQPGHQNRTRVKLFRVDTDMPSGCPIKAKFALRAIGYEGIYHLPACGSYPRLKRAHRWFCSEEDASAAGFRKALTCR
jgi:endonuclease YncB( thermonuclease family)